MWLTGRRRHGGPVGHPRRAFLPWSIHFGIDQWAYVPFDVPAGIQRIDVSTSHDTFSMLGIGRNVLDLGIFGPAGHELGNAEGFRGWSGGARAGFMLSAVNATPGYLAGPIEPGRWTLALGPVGAQPPRHGLARPDRAHARACSRRCSSDSGRTADRSPCQSGGLVSRRPTSPHRHSDGRRRTPRWWRPPPGGAGLHRLHRPQHQRRQPRGRQPHTEGW